jgi:hypothetical protein
MFAVPNYFTNVNAVVKVQESVKNAWQLKLQLHQPNKISNLKSKRLPSRKPFFWFHWQIIVGMLSRYMYL